MNGREDMPEAAEAASWTQFWSRGALHSCPGSFMGNYGGMIRTIWIEFFARLPDDARIVDIGTGNGAVAFIARDLASALGRRFQIEGVDIAQIAPSRAAGAFGLPMSGVVFQGGVAAEELPYADASIDAVTGQYALEYTSVARTIAELARVLRPGGRAMFVVHHADSEAVRTSHAELDALRFVTEYDALVPYARRLLRSHAADRASAPQAPGVAGPDAQKTVARMLERARKRAESAPEAAFLHGVVEQVSQALAEGPAAPAQALMRLEALAEEMSAHRTRLRAVVRAAHSPAAIASLGQAFAAAGFDVNSPQDVSFRAGALAGWVLSAVRQPPGA